MKNLILFQILLFSGISFSSTCDSYTKIGRLQNHDDLCHTFNSWPQDSLIYIQFYFSPDRIDTLGVIFDPVKNTSRIDYEFYLDSMTFTMIVSKYKIQNVNNPNLQGQELDGLSAFNSKVIGYSGMLKAADIYPLSLEERLTRVDFILPGDIGPASLAPKRILNSINKSPISNFDIRGRVNSQK